MDLLVAYKDDPAGNNMAEFISQGLDKDGDVFRGKKFDLLIIPSPVISADWLEEKFDYDNYVFLSKHAAESGVLALTCHSTGNLIMQNLVVIQNNLQFHLHHFKKCILKIFGISVMIFLISR